MNVFGMVNISSSSCIELFSLMSRINPLPHMPILGSSNSAANKDML